MASLQSPIVFPMQAERIEMVTDIMTAIRADDGMDAAAHANLLTKISELRSAVETPLETVLRIHSQPIENIVLRIAVEIGILDRGTLDEHSHFTLSQVVANARNTGKFKGDTVLLARMMRVLTAMGVCTEVGPQCYKANAVTEALAAPGLQCAIKFLFDAAVPTTAKLLEFFDRTDFKTPIDDQKSPFQFVHEVPIFQYLNTHPALSQSYNVFMSGRRHNQSTTFLNNYPLPSHLIKGAKVSSPFFVDIGGNQGHDLFQIRSRYPVLPGPLILQDLPQNLTNLDSNLIPTSPGTFAEIRPHAHDFFTQQPIVGARCYHIKAILHDWPDAACRKILQHIATAMKPGYSKLIIREFILAESGVPLFAACNDMLMMVLHAGMERTERQLRNLVEGVGLTVTQVEGVGGEGWLEAVKVDGGGDGVTFRAGVFEGV